MGAIASQITRLMIGYSTVYSGTDQRHQNTASLAFVRGIHRSPVNSPHKGPVSRKMFPFDDVIIIGFRAWISYYITPFNMDVLTYPCPNPGAGLANICQ